MFFQNIRKISWGALRKIIWSFTSPRFEMINEKEAILITGLIRGCFVKVQQESDTVGPPFVLNSSNPRKLAV